MRSVAVISDIHGNMPALEAVLEDLEQQSVDEVLVGGDLVGRGPQGSRVARRIRQLGWGCVRGNHEEYLLAFRHRKVPASWLIADEWSASRWMAAELDPDDVRYIESLPFLTRPRIADELLLVHGSPNSNNEGLGPWCSDEFLASQVNPLEEQVLVCAHTHRPLERRIGADLIVNVGAVGLPFNRDVRAQYAILRHDGEHWSAEFRQVAYDRDETLRIYETSGFLAAGGVTAELLRLELRHAGPFLVPFLKWAEATRRVPRLAEVDAFLDFYSVDESISDFFRRLKILP